jgi:hypothetical protein
LISIDLLGTSLGSFEGLRDLLENNILHSILGMKPIALTCLINEQVENFAFDNERAGWKCNYHYIKEMKKY